METESLKQLETIWDRVKDVIKETGLEKHVFEAFFAPSKLHSIQGNSFVIVATTNFGKDMFLQKFSKEIQDAIHLVTQSDYDFTVLTQHDIDQQKGSLPEQPKGFFSDSRLNSNLTFDNFVVGPFNNEAYQASLIVSDNPGKMYNPLFVYSDSGLGKTHLLNSIGNFIHQKFPKMKVLCISAEVFVDEYVEFVRYKQGDGDLKSFFKGVDVFLVGDVQALVGKTQTEAMFFAIFNTLVKNDPNYDRQIVLTSDRPPMELKGLEQRLVTRFQSGLTVNITRPDVESAKSILKRKIIASNLDINRFDDEVLTFFAEKYSNNIRELEGMLTRLIFYAITTKSCDHINMEIVLDALGSIGSRLDAKTKLDSNRIINTVADYYNISSNQLTGKNRIGQVALARHIAMYLMRYLLDIPLTKIGAVFGNAHHTTVMNGVQKVEGLLKSQPETKEVINLLKKRLKG